MDGMHMRVALASILAPVLVAGGALAGGYWASGTTADTRSSLTSALDSLPKETLVSGFTDWTLIRRHLGLGSASTASARASLNDDASLRDLSTRSVLGRSVEEMHDAYGWSAANVDWEIYGQATNGSVMVAHLDRSVSLDAVRAGLRHQGYVRRGRVWSVGETVGTSAGSDLATTLAAVAIVPRGRLVVAADRASYVPTVLDVIDRKQPSLLSRRPVSEVASSLVGTDSALFQTSAFACESTSLKDKAADVRAEGRAAVARAGGLVDVGMAGRGVVDHGDTGPAKTRQEMRFAMAFDSPAAAARQLRVRTALASGPFIGRTGNIEDSLVLTGSNVEGNVANLRFSHDPESAAFMVGSGPLLFASCPP